MAAPDPSTYFRKGFGLKAQVQDELAADYSGRLVDRMRAEDYALTVGSVTIRLAREFGFCYGVERAVEYAYQTRRKFPDRRIYLVGEIIHNPHVNTRLRDMGIEILLPRDGQFDFAGVKPEDVVILPAFGVTIHDFEELRRVGCVLVDTTCGSVLNVWKRVDSYAKDGFTAVIHGKYYHEETKATSIQVTKYPSGKYLVVRDMAEARQVCAYIEGAGSREQFLQGFTDKMSPGFDPDRDLARVGVANQTTMLSGESLAIAAEIRRSMAKRYGEAALAEHFRTFDTICSATQDRQDAVLKLIAEPLDLMVVIGGYNSSNTTHLAAICHEKVPTYHVEDAACIDPAAGAIRFRPVGDQEEQRRDAWLPTGSGKTFAAFLAAIDSLLRQGLEGTLRDETQVVYVSPLKALSNDVQKNLAEPLAEIRRTLEGMCLPDVEIRTVVRTGDTPAAERQAMVHRPPHILVTTPESLFLILTSERAREMLRSVRTVIVDEIHAVARDKRGSHLALSLERLEHLAGRRLQRIGLSATQKPIEDIAQFLVGNKPAARPQSAAPSAIDSGHARTLDLAIEIPSSPLEAVMAAEVWEEIYERLVQLILEHRTTLVFVNMRRLAERLTLHLSERLGADQVTSRHGSLPTQKGLDAETRLKEGTLKALAGTASPELGIDIGAVDLVCPIGSTR